MAKTYREVSERLNPDHAPKPADSKVVKLDLGPIRRQMLRPYKLPQLYNAGGKISERWFIFYYYLDPVNGKYRRFKVYDKLNSFHTKAERQECAAIILKATINALEKGFNPFIQPGEVQLSPQATLAEAVESFLSNKQVLRQKTLTGYKSVLKQFMTWAGAHRLTDVPFAEINRTHLRRYFDEDVLKARKMAATSHNTELTTLRSFFSFWHDEGIISLNPAKGIKRLKEEVDSHIVYDDKQINLITNHLSLSDTPRHKQMLHYLRFLYYTCIRPKEIRTLRIADIRMQTQTIVVPGKSSKSGRAEPVDISPGLADLIEEMGLTNLNPDWYIFGNQGAGTYWEHSIPAPGPKPVGVNYFSRAYRQILDELGFDARHTLYAWKHTRNVHLWLQDKDLLRLMRHNRHTDPKVTMRYLRSLGLLIDTRINDERRI